MASYSDQDGRHVPSASHPYIIRFSPSSHLILSDLIIFTHGLLAPPPSPCLPWSPRRQRMPRLERLVRAEDPASLRTSAHQVYKFHHSFVFCSWPPKLTDSSIEESRTPTQEVLFAAGVGLRADDPALPCLTLRMWMIGIGFCLVGSGVNTLYTFRFPSVTLSQSAIQFLAYPLGKAWEFVVPDWGVTLFGTRHSLNPGPFNYKACIPPFLKNMRNNKRNLTELL